MHQVDWEVNDLCGNSSTCSYFVTIEDGKKPSPVCIDHITTVVMPLTGCVEIEAAVYDAGSFDNCTASEDLVFSFSPDVSETAREFCCDELGLNHVEIWVTDVSGNQDFCITQIEIQDPNEVCDDISISGSIYREDGEFVEDVDVDLTMNLNWLTDYSTSANGTYFFGGLDVGAGLCSDTRQKRQSVERGHDL
jgi:hypothetical protein